MAERPRMRTAARKAARKKATGIATGAALAIGAALMPEAAHAATFTVTNTNDSGSGSLRDAIDSANAAAGADTIDFSVTGTIVLTSGELVISESVTIDGSGPAYITISGNDSSRVFNIDEGVAGTLQDVTLDGITVTGGFVASDGGGGIRSRENLTITDSAVTGNTAFSSGGIEQKLGSFALTNVSVTQNTAVESKGGLSVQEAASVTFSNVQIYNNNAGEFEGGAALALIDTLLIEDTIISGNGSPLVGGLLLFETSGTTTSIIRRTTISGNTASENWGGGIDVRATGLTIERSTISGNASASYGGGISLSDGSDATIENSTISGNYSATGAGLYLYNAGTVTVRHTTITSNVAEIDGANVKVFNSIATLDNTIVANGSAVANPDVLVLTGSLTANYSLVETPPSGGLSGANNITNVDPQLGPLQGNGGALPLTHAPASTSPAIDAGDPLFASPPATDQRGFDRVYNGQLDIGSVELHSSLTLSSATYSVDEDGGTVTITVDREGGTSGAVSLDYSTSSNTAQDGLDYTAASGTLNWADGDGTSKTFDVTITDDNVFEEDETFDVHLDNPDGGAAIDLESAAVTITDDETEPSASITNVSQSEGSSGTTAFTFEVTLSGPRADTIEIDYATADGTASAGSDYTAANATVTFNPGVTSQNVIIDVTGDSTTEDDETFTVTLSSPDDYPIANGTGTGTIENDDAPFGAPQGFSATAPSASQVTLSWSAVTGATSYEIFRATSITSGFSLLTTTAGTSHNDTDVTAGTTYLYKVRAVGAGGATTFSAVDAATTIAFTDPALNSSISAKTAHITELRTAVNAMRAAGNLGAATFTDPTLTAQSTEIKSAHVTELRVALDQARAAIGLAALAYTDPTITPESTTVKAAHITELRSGVS